MSFSLISPERATLDVRPVGSVADARLGRTSTVAHAL